MHASTTVVTRGGEQTDLITNGADLACVVLDATPAGRVHVTRDARGRTVLSFAGVEVILTDVQAADLETALALSAPVHPIVDHLLRGEAS